ncbi:MAG TPA: APC family permease [Solirubrobacteraceae bacterium]|jgi:amino acid transporter|nr:APC family permease [Solirubrobacteraceae bacterium]
MGASEAKTGLRKRSIGFWESLALSVEAMGPLLGALSVAPLIAISAGFSAPFIVLVCGFAMCIVALTITRFARQLPSAASIYSYVSHGLGERAGFLSAWLSFMYYVLFVPQLLLAFGLYAHSGLDYVFGIDLPWWIYSMLAAGIALTLSLVGIRISTRIDLGLAILANLVLLIASIALVSKVSHLSLGSLTPTHAAGGFTGLSLAVASGVLIFLGFEQSFTLGEEVRDPHGNVPRAIFVALISIGLLLLFACFAMVSAFGVHGIAALTSANAADGTPWWAAFRRVGLGSGWRDALSLVIMTSVLGNTIASHNAVVRIQYGMGRAKALPSAFGRTGTRQTPYFAISVQIAVSVIVTLVMGGAWNTTKAFGFLGFTNGLAGAVAFILILLAAMVYFHKVEPEKGYLRNLVIPAVGIAILIPAVYTAFYPNPGAPLKWSPYVIVGWTLLGGIYLLARDARHQPIDLDYAFRDLGEETPAGALATEPAPVAALASDPA